jgi:hypothetical protein
MRFSVSGEKNLDISFTSCNTPVVVYEKKNILDKNLVASARIQKLGQK